MKFLTNDTQIKFRKILFVTVKIIIFKILGNLRLCVYSFEKFACAYTGA